MVVKRERVPGRHRKREREREGLVTIIMDIKGLSARSACSPPLQFGRRGYDGGRKEGVCIKKLTGETLLFPARFALLSHICLGAVSLINNNLPSAARHARKQTNKTHTHSAHMHTQREGCKRITDLMKQR